MEYLALVTVVVRRKTHHFYHRFALDRASVVTAGGGDRANIPAGRPVGPDVSARVPRPVRTPDPPPPFAAALTTPESRRPLSHTTTALSRTLIRQRWGLKAAAQPSATEHSNRAPHTVSSCPADPGVFTAAVHP